MSEQRGRRTRRWLRRGGGAWALLCLPAVACAPGSAAADGGRATAARADSCAGFDHGHAAWTALLKGHVAAGVVDYTGLARPAERRALDAYLATLGGVCRDHYGAWSKEQKLAYWINVYNAYTVRLILDHHPIESIRSIGLLPGAAWRQEIVAVERLRGAVISLDDVEHKILRKELKEARIHFAIVCASKGCPEMRAGAFTADGLEGQLAAATRTFLADPSHNRYDGKTKTLWLSAIFDWFAGDFEAAAGSVRAFVAAHGPPSLAAALPAEGLVIKHLDYDWSLNGK